MTNLTLTEKNVLNNLSRVINREVSLGDKLDEMVNAVGVSGTPVNAVAASEILTISGLVADGETVSIDNPAKSGADIYEFLTDDAQTKTIATNIAVNISANAVKASGTLTVIAQPISGDTITIGTKTYIFVPAGTANGNGEVSIGTDLATAQASIVAAINGTDTINTPHPLVSAAAFAANACIITAFVGGAVGNAIATTETLTNAANIFAAVTLTSGANCTAANATLAIAAAIVANDTQDVAGVKGTGSSVVLTSDVAGVVGNAITIAKTMANATFGAGATHLSGGIDGTVATSPKIMIDDTYLYVCRTANTISGANWRRIAIGAAY